MKGRGWKVLADTDVDADKDKSTDTDTDNDSNKYGNEDWVSVQNMDRDGHKNKTMIWSEIGLELTNVLE